MTHALRVLGEAKALESFFTKYRTFTVKAQNLSLFWSRRGYRPACDNFRLRVHGIDSEAERKVLAEALGATLQPD